MKQLLTILIFFTAVSLLNAQQRIISGKIIDATSTKELAGVTIRSAIGHNISISDSSGIFHIGAEENDTLFFSSVGFLLYTVEINTNNSSRLTIAMLRDRNTRLTDVVVYTGYQIVPKERSTGSFVQVDKELLNRATGSNIINRLVGITSSVLFDNNPSHPPVTIRGIGTLTNAYDITSPLIVLDNFPYEGDINNINPNDIESVTILRDAASASIWGAKAGNGVIVINSKKSKYNQPAQFSINTNITVAQKPDLFAVSQMTSSDFIDVEQFLFHKGFYDADIVDSFNFPVITPVIQILNQQRNGQISPSDANAQIDALRSIDVRNDYLRYLYRKAVQQQYSLALSGGKENISYRTSIGFDNNLAAFAGNEDNRITFNSEFATRPIKNLFIRIGATGVWAKSYNNSPIPISIGQSKDLYPYAELADNSGNAQTIERDYRSQFKDTAGNSKLLNWDYKPLDELNNADNFSIRNSHLLFLDVRYTVTPSISASVKYQFHDEKNTNNNYYSAETYYTRNLINLFSAVEGDNVNRAIPLGGILDLQNFETISHGVRGQLDYNKTFQKKHLISAITGAEIRQSKTKGTVYRTYGYDEENLTSVNVNYIDRYPIINGLNYSPVIPNRTDFTGLLNRIISAYANASYTYRNKYTISGSARKDASNILGVSTNNKWKPLWSAGLGWKVCNENFYHKTWLPLLKLRLTYGSSGNVNNAISALTTLQYVTTNRSRISTLPYAQVVSPPNEDLRWEKISTTNMGLDFSSKNGIVNGTIEYYFKKSTDVIAGTPVDVTIFGGTSLEKNSAILFGKGIDISLNATILDRNVKWESSILYSHNKVEVSKYLLPSAPYINVGEGGNIAPLEGQNPYNVISYKWGGLNAMNGNPIGYLDNKKSEDYYSIINGATWDDLVISGSAIPESFGAWRNMFSYKHLSVSVNLTYKFGYHFRKRTINYTDLFGSGVANGDFEKRWQNPGDETKTSIPSMVYPIDYYRDVFYLRTESTVRKGDHVRLQDISLAYNVSRDKPQTPQLHFYLYFSNLGILWRANKDNIDPDTNFNYPVPFSVSAGCKIDF